MSFLVVSLGHEVAGFIVVVAAEATNFFGHLRETFLTWE